jgi:hypothetical protein
MLNYVNTVLVSNVNGTNIVTGNPTQVPARPSSKNAASTDAGKFVIMNCDPTIDTNKLYNVTAQTAGSVDTIKVGIVTKQNTVLRKQDGSVEYLPIIKWSNEIKANDIKSFNTMLFDDWNTPVEDTVIINFSGLDQATLAEFAKGGKRIIVRLTYKDMPHRYRKWTESYEYVTKSGDTKATIAYNIANMINNEWKRARVQTIVGSVSGSTFTNDANWGTSSATTGTAIKIVALPYDDDDSVDSLNWANKVRFNANIYWTDPAGEGWESNNKHFPNGVVITKRPGEEYPNTAKRVRDRESWAMGYQGILNRGEGTWPIIKPAMETDLSKNYDGITLEFENMYRAADDIQRKTKQTLEVYAIAGRLEGLKDILTAFVTRENAAQPQ